MWELWVRIGHAWYWRVIGAASRGDLTEEVAEAMAEDAITEIRVISDVAQRPRPIL
jgi:hypothetical protein